LLSMDLFSVCMYKILLCLSGSWCGVGRGYTYREYLTGFLDISFAFLVAAGMRVCFVRVSLYVCERGGMCGNRRVTHGL
jgi:hypothetical protein